MEWLLSTYNNVDLVLPLCVSYQMMSIHMQTVFHWILPLHLLHMMNRSTSDDWFSHYFKYFFLLTHDSKYSIKFVFIYQILIIILIIPILPYSTLFTFISTSVLLLVTHTYPPNVFSKSFKGLSLKYTFILFSFIFIYDYVYDYVIVYIISLSSLDII